uniref:Inward rectifier potassium channel C-terminal domain-containing protein n=1 Tax=Bos mutus grunniens TaxID=30521 RepID=A0A8B9YY56_BOSMU
KNPNSQIAALLRPLLPQQSPGYTPKGAGEHEPLLQQLPHRERGPQVPGVRTGAPSGREAQSEEASAAQGRQLQRVLQAHFRGVGQLRGGHLHHPRGHQVAPHVCNLLAVLHPLLADFRSVFWLIAFHHGDLQNDGPDATPAWTTPTLHGAPLLPGDPDHHRHGYRQGHRGVPGGRAHGHPAVHPELRHQHLHHRGGPGQDGHGQEEGADHPVQLLRAGGHEGRQALPHVAHRGLPPQPRGGGHGARAAAALRGGRRGAMTMAFKDLRLLNDQIILVTPVTVVHEIDCDSPLYALDRKAVARDNFEILVTFIYTGDSTGTSHQSRSSYIPREILWGHRFHDVLEVKRKYYKVNCLQFEGSVEVYAPFCSAKQLDWKDQQLHSVEKAPPVRASALPDAKVRRRSFSCGHCQQLGKPEETTPLPRRM